MTRRLLLAPVLAALVSSWVASGSAAQDPFRVASARTGVFFESYTFDPGLVFTKITEITVPVGIDLRLGRLGTLALSSGFARANLSGTDPSLGDQEVSGALDTEARLSIPLSRDRFMLLLGGAAPTGIKTVQIPQLVILGPLSSDVIGFSASNLGTGGNIGGGFVGAIPAGKMAFGFGATAKLPLSYQPVVSLNRDLKPGFEVRVRSGIEGPIATRTYLRVAAVVARTGKDRFRVSTGDSTQNGVGTRFVGYASINHRFGKATVTVYGFDVFRASPQIETTALGAAVLPKGNLLAGGLRLDLAAASRTTVSPRFEVRRSSAGSVSVNPTTGGTTVGSSLQKIGQSVRVGADIRQVLSPKAAFVLQGGGLFGNVAQVSGDIGFKGFRTSLQLEITP